MVGLENPLHWLVILLVALLVFGPKRLPQVGRSIGSGIREFRSSIHGAGDDDDRGQTTEDRGQGPEPKA